MARKEQIFEQCHWKCVYCGEAISKSSPLFEDRLIPKRREGSCCHKNLVASCDACRALKGSWAKMHFPKIWSVTPSYKFYLEPEDKQAYLVVVIDYILEEAKAQKDTLLRSGHKRLSEISIDDYIRDLEKNLADLRAPVLAKNIKSAQRSLDD